MNIDEIWKLCIEEAKKSIKMDDVPIGAVIMKNGKVLAKAHNNRQKKANVMGHAEINAILKATKKCKNWNLNGCILYVTLRPCSMCMEIIKQARIDEVYYLLEKSDAKKEYSKTKCYHYDSVCEQMYKNILSNFFHKMR